MGKDGDVLCRGKQARMSCYSAQDTGIFILHFSLDDALAEGAIINGRRDGRTPGRRGIELCARHAQRAEHFPLAETLKGFEIDTWWGLVAPAATPKDMVSKLNQAFVAALNSPEAKARLATLMAEPVANTPEEFAAFMKSELAKYEKVVKASGARVD